MIQLALTLGDPAGIGPEVVLKALADAQIQRQARIVVFGSRSILAQTYANLQGKTTDRLVDPARLEVRNLGDPGVPITPGVTSAAAGAASFAYLDAAITACLAGEFAGVVTAPIAKAAWQAAGHDYPGQTELLAERAGCPSVGMAFVARSPHTGWILRCVLATTHLPLAAVPARLTPELLSAKLDLLVAWLWQDFGLARPKIAIAGLNPHSGEGGQLGREEVDHLLPWLEGERAARPEVELVGLVPPDTLWIAAGQAWWREVRPGLPDAYLALYHDQGLIPVKLLAFEQAVNTTLGLPFVRTSPDHGTAFDIAGQGRAQAASLQAAIAWAVDLVRSRGG